MRKFWTEISDSVCNDLKADDTQGNFLSNVAVDGHPDETQGPRPKVPKKHCSIKVAGKNCSKFRCVSSA